MRHWAYIPHCGRSELTPLQVKDTIGKKKSGLTFFSVSRKYNSLLLMQTFFFPFLFFFVLGMKLHSSLVFLDPPFAAAQEQAIRKEPNSPKPDYPASKPQPGRCPLTQQTHNSISLLPNCYLRVWEGKSPTHGQPQKRFLSRKCDFHLGAPLHESSLDRNNL